VNAYLGDIIIGIVMLCGIIFGWRRGLVKIIGGCGAIYFGIVVGRHITSWLMPVIDGLIGQAALSGPNPPEQKILATLLFSDSFTARIIEVVLLIFITLIVVKILRRLAHFLGNAINHTPFIGFISRFFGACIAFLVFVAALYAVMLWVFPLLADVSFIKKLEDILRSSRYLLPYVQSFGSWAWSMAAAGVALWQAR
jgi:uncharacterized membrane protein required for colicin V production